jgi:hypothetical protein
MGIAYFTYVREERCIQRFSLGYLRERAHSVNIGVDGMGWDGSIKMNLVDLDGRGLD